MKRINFMFVAFVVLLAGFAGTVYATSAEDGGKVTVNVPAEGVTTFACNKNLDFSGVAGVEAFYCTGVNEENDLVFVAVDGAVPAGTGLYIKAAEGKYEIPVAEKAEQLEQDNCLTAVLNDVKNVTPEEGMMNYVLRDGKFRKAPEMTLNAGKAYISLPYETIVRARGVKTADDDGYDIHVADKFDLHFVPIGDYKYATICLACKSWRSRDWEGAYLVSWDGTAVRMVQMQKQLIPANVAVIIRKVNNDNQEETVKITESGSWNTTDDFTVNRLVGYQKETQIIGDEDIAYYGLNYSTVDDVRKIGFFAPKGSDSNPHGNFTAVANRAYLKLVSATVSKKKYIYWGTDDELGDVNADGSVNVTDVVELNQSLLGGNEDDLDFDISDVNKDKVLNVTDIVELVGKILK